MKRLTLFLISLLISSTALAQSNPPALTLDATTPVRANGGAALDIYLGDTFTISLSNSGVSPGTYGDATHIPQITVDALGRITAATQIAGSGGGGYSTLEIGGAALPQRSTLNFSTVFSAVDNSGAARTDVDLANGGVLNIKLANSSVTVGTVLGQLVGGGAVALGAGLSLGLAATSVTAGSYGDSTHVPAYTVDLYGRLTAASSVLIASDTINTISPLVGGGTIAPGGSLTVSCPTCVVQAYTTVKDSSGNPLAQRSNLKFGVDFSTVDAPPDTTVALATTAVTAGSYGDATHVPAFTVDTKGRLTAASSVAITAGVTSISNSDGTLTISPTTGAAVASLALGHVNTWTATQSFPAASIPNPTLVNSSLTVAGTAGQINVSGGSPVALGGMATLSLPNVGTAGTSTFATGDSVTTDAQGRVSATSTVMRNINTAAGDLTGGGDLTADRTLALALTTVAAGSYGDATHVPAFTVDAKGRLTVASSVAITAGVTSISNSDGTLTISPTTGAAVASLALGHANTWTATQSFPAASIPNPTLVNSSLTVAGTAGQINVSGGSPVALGGMATLSLPNVGTAGTSTFATGDSVTTDAQGRVSATSTVTRTLIGGAGINAIGTLAADRTISVDQGFSPTWTGNHTFSNPIADSATATAANQLTRKDYVDSLSGRPPALVVATSNVTISGPQTVDGVALVAGNRALLIAQTTGSQNGPWIVQSGAWTRPNDFQTGSHASGTAMFVQLGATNPHSGWLCTNAPTADVVDTNTLVFTQLQYTAGTGLTLTFSQFGGQFAITNTGVTAATYGDATHVAQIAVNAQGQITSASSVAITAGVTSISNSDGTLTISPTTGAAVASLALGHVNTWTATQSFPAASIPNPTLVNSSLTVAGTAGQINVSGGSPVALGGMATLSLPNVGTAGTSTFATGDSVTTDAQGRVSATSTVTRNINTTGGLTGGGTIAADRTISIGGVTDTVFSVGALSWTGSSGKAASLVASGAAITITADASSTWRTTTGNLTIDAASSLLLATSSATAVQLGRAANTTNVFGNVTLGSASTDTLSFAAQGNTNLQFVNTRDEVINLATSATDTAGHKLTITAGASGAASASPGTTGGQLNANGGVGAAGTVSQPGGGGGAYQANGGVAGTNNGAGSGTGGSSNQQGGQGAAASGSSAGTAGGQGGVQGGTGGAGSTLAIAGDGGRVIMLSGIPGVDAGGGGGNSGPILIETSAGANSVGGAAGSPGTITIQGLAPGSGFAGTNGTSGGAPIAPGASAALTVVASAGGIAAAGGNGTSGNGAAGGNGTSGGGTTYNSGAGGNAGAGGNTSAGGNAGAGGTGGNAGSLAIGNSSTSAGGIGGAGGTVSAGGTNGNGGLGGNGSTTTYASGKGGAGGQAGGAGATGGNGGPGGPVALTTGQGGAGGAANGGTAGTGGTSGALTISTGSGGSANGGSGNITIDVGAKNGTGTNGTITIGGTNASALTNGRSGITTTEAGIHSFTGGITASGSTANDFSGSTGDFDVSTGSLSWAGASTKTASIVSTGAGSTITITAGAASTWSSDDGTVKAATFDRTTAGTLTIAGTATAITLSANTTISGAGTFTSGSGATIIGAAGGSYTNHQEQQTGQPLKVGVAIASAATIAPTAPLTHITGTTNITTITAPTDFAQSGGGGCLRLIFDSAGHLQTGGNIAVAFNPSANTFVEVCYDNATSTWYPQ